MAELLYEIGTEELPAGYIEPALRDLASGIERLLEEHRLRVEMVLTAGTPHRLTVAATGLPERQASLEEKTIGPPARAAFDGEGKPTGAALGFAKSRGVPVDELVVEETEKGPYVAAVVEKQGLPAIEVLPGLLEAATRAISFPKSMRWLSGGIEFARPIRWLVALLDDEVIRLAVNGVESGRSTFGHRFLSPGPVQLENASFKSYREALRKRSVIVDPEERRDQIRVQIDEILKPHGTELTDEALLAEVANLVEHPHAVEGAFDQKFLELPPCVLVTAMKDHQRYFPVFDAQGNILPRFVTVSDRTGRQAQTVRRGNERVLSARLEDAAFYWREDVRAPLGARVPELKTMVFLGGLGSNFERTHRLVALGRKLASGAGLSGTEVAHVERAAFLCKVDLLTGLVGEFPSLQGVLGGELARRAGEPQAVADAIAEHYKPCGADDSLPTSTEGAVLSIADRLDVIVGCFALGLVPSGSQDPYALRRNAQAILTIAERRELRLGLRQLIEFAADGLADAQVQCGPEAVERILEFFRERLYYAAIERGYRHDFVRACLAVDFNDVPGFWLRLKALKECTSKEWWPELVELVDRTYRIQRDAEDLAPAREDLLAEQPEIDLFKALSENRDALSEAFQEKRFVEAAQRYCGLFAKKVHIFFEEVFVNVEDEDVRRNRKALCAEIYRLFADRFADLYLLEDTEA